jgi:hypothetical protein
MDPSLAAEIEDLVSKKVKSFAVLGNLNGADIETLVSLVLMEAAKGAQEDLKAIMADVKAMNAAKQALRHLISQVQKDVVGNFGCTDRRAPLDLSPGLGSEEAYHSAPMPFPNVESSDGLKLVPTDLFRGRLETLAQLESVLENLKNRLDSMSEMGEMLSLRLQMAMDRRSKLMETLSNIMKKISSTESAIVQNLK